MSLDIEALAIVESTLAIEDPGERTAFLDKRCGPDGDLRACVDRLLSFEGADFSLLPTESFVRPLTVIDNIPDQIGPYRVTREIARGGMGAVVEGQRNDGMFEQIVAIKLIRGDLATSRAQARFAEERRILARLRHPGIVRILDGGQVDERPWLAMDFVDGEPVTEALDRKNAGRDARLDAFEAVCDAVAHAHRQLVIHADIKPSNVLMTEDGRVQLLDFGIARLIVDLDVDESGAPFPLTRGYAAPERGSGAPPTIASDVFSLGVLLLAMLGCPVPGSQARFVPGTRLPEGQLQGDLAAIAARALAQDPAARYPDVAALLSDIRRHRAWIPVAARGDTGWRYVAGRFMWRHRRGLSLAAIVGLALLGVSIVSTVQYARAERERVEAERRFHEVRRLAGFLLTDLSNAMADAPGTVAARAQLAEIASSYLDRLRLVPNAPLDLRLETAQGFRRLAALQGLSGGASLGKPSAARKSLDRAEALLRGILVENPGNASALEEAGWVATERWTIGADNAASVQINRQAAQLFGQALARDPRREGAVLGLLVTEKSRAYDLIWGDKPTEAIPVLRQALARLRLARFAPENRREAQLLEANMLSRLGDALYYSGDVNGSLAPYRQVEAIIDAALARKRSVVWLDKLGEAKFNISGTLQELPGRREDALAEARQGEVAMQQVLAFGPDATIEKRLLVLYGQEGLLLSELGRHREAVAASNASLALRRQRLAREPRDPQRNRDLAVALPVHAEMLARAGLAAQACAAAQEGVRAWLAIRAAGNLGSRDAAKDLPEAQVAARRLCGA